MIHTQNDDSIRQQWESITTRANLNLVCMVSFMIEKISIKFVQHIIQSQTCSPSTVCYAAWPPRLAGAPLWRRRRGARSSWTGWRPPSGGGTPTRTASSPGQSSNRCTVHTVQYIVYSLDSVTTVWKVKCDSMTVWQRDSASVTVWQRAVAVSTRHKLNHHIPAKYYS